MNRLASLPLEIVDSLKGQISRVDLGMFVSKDCTLAAHHKDLGYPYGEKSSVGGCERSDADLAVDVYTKVSTRNAEMTNSQ